MQMKRKHRFTCDLLCFQNVNQNGGNQECPDLDFVYADTDTHPNEIAELYSYTEQNEFQLNVKVNSLFATNFPLTHIRTGN